MKNKYILIPIIVGLIISAIALFYILNKESVVNTELEKCNKTIEMVNNFIAENQKSYDFKLKCSVNQDRPRLNKENLLDTSYQNYFNKRNAMISLTLKLNDEINKLQYQYFTILSNPNELVNNGIYKLNTSFYKNSLYNNLKNIHEDLDIYKRFIDNNNNLKYILKTYSINNQHNILNKNIIKYSILKNHRIWFSEMISLYHNDGLIFNIPTLDYSFKKISKDSLIGNLYTLEEYYRDFIKIQSNAFGEQKYFEFTPKNLTFNKRGFAIVPLSANVTYLNNNNLEKHFIKDTVYVFKKN